MAKDRDWWNVHLYHVLSFLAGVPLAFALMILIYLVQDAAGLAPQAGSGAEELTTTGAAVALFPALVVGLAIVGTWLLGFLAYYLDARTLSEADADYAPLWPVYALGHVVLGPIAALVYLVRRYQKTGMDV